VDREAGIDLQRRALGAFVRMLGRGSDGASVFERDGVVGSIVPAVPERSVVNSVAYRDAGALGAALDDLADAYESAGVRAWTVWVPDPDREAAATLERAGHVLDAAPAAMVLDLSELPEPDLEGLDWDDGADAEEVGRINDLAYGLETGSFSTAISALPANLPLRLYQARIDGEPASVVGTLDEGDDCGIYLVATLREHRGMGLARRLLHAALAQARERGLATSSLQATKLGYSVYERLGYRPICTLEMWERRR
jgi:GNAT superfamily N-acetyltransferase